MPATLAALKKIQRALSSSWLDNSEMKGHLTFAAAHEWPEPGPLGRSVKTGGCRLPTQDSIASVWKTFQLNRGQQEVDASTANELAADLARPFGQSTGRGFSFTRFRLDRGYQTLTMRQRDVFAPWMGPDHTATIRTLYEIGFILTRADPICSRLQCDEEYPSFVPNMTNFGLDQTFSLPIAAQDLEPQAAARLLPGRGEIHKRLWCALFHEADCECPDSIAFKAL